MTQLMRKKNNGGMMPTLRTDLSELFDFDRFFNEPFKLTSLWNKWGQSILPPTNVSETEKEYILEVAAPGLKKSDFEIDLDNGKLEIKVEKEEEMKKEEKQYMRREYSYNAFYRCFDVPEAVKAEKIKAEYNDGILKVHLPKIKEAAKKKPQMIEVK